VESYSEKRIFGNYDINKIIYDFFYDLNMIQNIKKNLEELKERQAQLNPKIQKIKDKRDEEIAELKESYEKKIAGITSELDGFKKKLSNDLINSFEKAVMKEFEAKRSTSEYSLTETFKDYRDFVAGVDMFPEDLVSELDKVISGENSIEDIAYNLEDIKKEYLIA
jgi:DNA repair exonuclease SbcCD ATPase subunit